MPPQKAGLDTKLVGRAQLEEFGKLRTDYVFPGYTAPEEDDSHGLDDKNRRSSSRAFREKLKQAEN